MSKITHRQLVEKVKSVLKQKQIFNMFRPPRSLLPTTVTSENRIWLVDLGTKNIFCCKTAVYSFQADRYTPLVLLGHLADQEACF